MFRSLLHPRSRRRAFSLLELLVVLAIIAILAVLLVPAIGALLRSGQVDQSVNTLTGLLEQAREAAVGKTTYTWVAFSDPATTAPVRGIYAVILESQDGSESPVNTKTPPVWQASLTVPTTNLQVYSKLQNLPGVALIVDVTSLSSTVKTAINTANAASPPPTANLSALTGPLTWTFAPLGRIPGYSSTAALTRAIEFTPGGEARTYSTAATTWYDQIQFAVVPSGTDQRNATIINVSRTTGRATTYRP